MLSLRDSLAAVASYRLGYSPQRRQWHSQHPVCTFRHFLAYPWRWTTPLALFMLLAITAVLTCLNIPLSAYETVQEFTYFPNATIPALPMSNMIPSFLRSPGATFAPQALHVGDTFRLNNSLWTYTIVNAFDGTDSRKPVSSVPYFNNPFDSCDVTNITVEFGFSPELSDIVSTEVTGLVTCTQPTVFQMTWGPNTIDHGTFASLVVPWFLSFDVGTALLDLALIPLTVGITVRPCCNCTENAIESEANIAVASQALESALLEPPCSTEPTRFGGLGATVQNTSVVGEPGVIWATSPNITGTFATMPGSTRKGYIGSGDPSQLNVPLQNLCQAYYHLVRRDLGVVLKNNIYLSPEMFNNSITGPTATDPQTILRYAGVYRAQTSNETVMAQWRETFAVFNETDRVPVLEYLRPVPRLKPMGSAITSVFVATFAMVSTVWTIFSGIARAFVNSSDDSESVLEKERFDVEAKRSFEEIEPTESSSFTAPYKDPTYEDHRWNILVEEVARLANVIERIENNLPDTKPMIERMESIENDLREMQRNIKNPEKGGE